MIVSGTASEFNGLTQIAGTVTIEAAPGRYAQPLPVKMSWKSTVDKRENLESMLYRSNEKFLAYGPVEI